MMVTVIFNLLHSKYFSDELQPEPPQLESIQNSTTRTRLFNIQLQIFWLTWLTSKTQNFLWTDFQLPESIFSSTLTISKSFYCFFMNPAKFISKLVVFVVQNCHFQGPKGKSKRCKQLFSICWRHWLWRLHWWWRLHWL
jgi:phage terminase large subunit-like protein